VSEVFFCIVFGLSHLHMLFIASEVRARRALRLIPSELASDPPSSASPSRPPSPPLPHDSDSDSHPNSSDEDTNYEITRAANIARNKKILEEMGLRHQAQELHAAMRKAECNPPPQPVLSAPAASPPASSVAAPSAPPTPTAPSFPMDPNAPNWFGDAATYLEGCHLGADWSFAVSLYRELETLLGFFESVSHSPLELN
jgi:hypothetical protein